ncbi:hypothetical protein AVDCRST_MAG82-550 [uncultured Rubrobacteraceae bacterium]|uniref:Yip1 domain-containing protein n=1 Tax=uncultured Rubrobacteraceae bacterium TaxID=349277 RepID=A0A6J4P631_9ACTN|nr:hypothetical protein AVDCRST_MAG82-550 [uncultured Rubrobacteraceae bacterium]
MREEIRVDFNTGSGGSSGGSSGGPGGPPPRVSGGPSGGEFSLGDPVQSFVAAVRSVVTGPVGFFSSIRREGDLVNPLIFAIICYEVAAILGGLLGLVGLGLGQTQGFGSFLISIILAPIFAAIGLFIGAGILHLLVMLIVGSRNSGFVGTFRVSAYSSVTSLVSWIPFVGWVASLYGIYLAIVGIREVHGTTTGKAALVVLIPAVVVFVLIVILIFAVGALFYFGTGQ